MRNLFVGVQSTLEPIAPSLTKFLIKQGSFDNCIIRAPLGLKLNLQRPLQFDDILWNGPTEHLDISLKNLTMFIGAPDLVPTTKWELIANTIGAWYELDCKSICFEAMIVWNAQFQFAYDCCKIAGIKVMVEGIPTPEMPTDIEILLQSQRYVNNLRLGNLSLGYEYSVIVRKDALKFSGVFKGLFKTEPTSLDDLQAKIESSGARVFRYPI